MENNKLISSIVETQIPQFIRHDYPNFVAFIKAYYEWAEQEGEAYHFIANNLQFNDIDSTSLELLNHFATIYLEPLPDVIYEQNRVETLIKHITEHYSAKGTEKAFKFLFQLIEQKQIEFYYPSYDMLRISDGKWVMNKSIKIIDPPENVMDWESSEIEGYASHAKAIIDTIDLYESSSGVQIAELFLVDLGVINTISGFIVGETFNGTTKDGVEFSDEIEKVFHSVEVLVAGKYYQKENKILVSSSNGEDTRVVVGNVTKGSIESISIVNGGVDYVVNDALKFNSSCFGTGAYGRVTEVDGSGTITAVDITFGGYQYQSMPSVEITSENGSGAFLMSESESIGGIRSVIIRRFGINYETGDILTPPLQIRIYDRFMEYEIGEEISNGTGGTGIIESFDMIGGTMSIRLLTGSFASGDIVTGARMGATATIHDTSLAIIDYVEGAVCYHEGKYLNRDGHISSTKYIQDSYFYQMFSYMIRTYEKRENWIDHIKPVHPAGTIVFGYREVPNKSVFNESYGGFCSPSIDVTETYKFNWILDSATNSNTQIKQYANVIIDEVFNITSNEKNKTGFCFGSEIIIS